MRVVRRLTDADIQAMRSGAMVRVSAKERSGRGWVRE